MIQHSLSSFKPSSNSSFILSSKQSYQILFPFLVSIFSSSSESFISQLLSYSAPSSESLLLTESIRNELYLQFIQSHSDYIPTTLHSFLSKNSSSFYLSFLSLVILLQLYSQQPQLIYNSLQFFTHCKSLFLSLYQ